MRISQPHKRFLRVGLLAIIAAVSYWVCSSEATSARVAARPAKRPQMFVLQVGIGKYKHSPTWAELRGAVTDVVEMRKVLEGERYGIPPENIVTLTDEQGTKQQIFEKFRSHLIANAEKEYRKTKNRKDGAIILFQFSGHGSQAPDQNGDERDDGKDETLVTHDSEDAPGKNFDISDDEIFALTSKLQEYTDNIVYILDSCHSGSGTRDAQDVRRLPERKNPVVAIAGVENATRSGETKSADSESQVLPPGSDYIVITAARANELASQKNCFEECGDARRPVVYGNLTFYLIDELKNARADTSYRELMENVTRRVVAEKPTQTPQIEGDRSRFVFGSLGRKEDNFIRIVEGETKTPNGARIVKIAAGAMQGLTAGTVVSFYDKTVTRFDGVEKISSGIVTAVTPAESVVRLTGPKREITTGDKSVVVAPELGSRKLRVNLDLDVAKLNVAQKKVIGEARRHLTPPPDELSNVDVVDAVAAAQGRWDVAVLKDKFAMVAPKMGTGSTSCEIAGTLPDGTKTAPDADVFYMAGKDFVPMFGFCLDAGASNEDAAAERIRDVILHLAHLRSVSAIANPRSALRGKVTVKPVRLTGPFGCDENTSRLTYSTSTPVLPDPKTGYYDFAVGDAMWFEVTNNSSRDLYLTLLAIGVDGSVKLHSPRAIAGEQDGLLIAKNGGKRILMGDDCGIVNNDTGAFVIAAPAGLETHKLIVSVKPTKQSEYLYLTRPAVAITARTGRASLLTLDDWTTVDTVLRIIDTGN